MKSKRKTILVVDDDERILESLKVILESEGYAVSSAETGEEAIERNKTDFFDMALLDIKLPGMQGTELLAALHKESPRMVKIMMTGYPSLENAVASLKLGADAYVMKPVNPEKLLDVIEKKFRERNVRD
jgi:DNA-binding NtrC family response regulator